MSSVSYINDDLTLRRITAAASSSVAAQRYLALLEELGYNPQVKNLDLATFSKMFSNLKNIQNFLGIDDANYILNLAQYDTDKLGITGTDSFYISAYDNEGSYVDQAFGWSDLTEGFNSVDSYINPFDYAVIETLDDFYGKTDLNGKSLDQKIAALYNYVITNFSYIQENKDDWNFAGETIFQRGGDCEDLSILMASLGMALMLNEGVSYDEANSRFSVVAGTDAKYGDHVYIEYTAGDGTVYVMDTATAAQGTISNVTELLKKSENTSFEVYFRFNDTKVLKETVITSENKSYINATDSTVGNVINQLRTEGLITETMSGDELVMTIFQYFKDQYSYVDSSNGAINFAAAAATGLCNDETFACMMMSLVLAGLKDLGYDDTLLSADMHVGVFKSEDTGESVYAFVYKNRVFDLSAEISGQLSGETMDDIPLVSAVGAEETQTYDLENNIQQRSIKRFNPQYGSYLAQSIGSASKNVISASALGALSDSPLKKIGGFSNWNYLTGGLKSGLSASEIVTKLNSTYEALKNNYTNDNNPYVRIVYSADNFSQNIKSGIAAAVSNMANFKNYINDKNGFWYFDEDAYNRNINSLNFYQNLVSLMAIVNESKTQAYNIVVSELFDGEGYRSINAASMIKTENENFSKGAVSMRDDLKNMISSHNEQLNTLSQKYLSEEMTKRITAATTTTLAGVLVVGGISFFIGNDTLSNLFTAGVALLPTPSAAAGAAMIAAAGIGKLLGIGPTREMFLKAAAKVISLQKVNTEWIKKFNFEKNKDIASWAEKQAANASVSTNKSAQYFAAEKSSYTGSAEFNTLGISNLYNRLTVLASLGFKTKSGFNYEDDASVQDTLADLRRTMMYMKARNKILEEKKKSYSIVHQELTGKTTYSSTGLVEEGISREFEQIEKMASRIVEARSKWITQQNAFQKAKNEAALQSKKCAWVTSAFIIGAILDAIPFTGEYGSSGYLMSIAEYACNEMEYDTATDYDPSALGLNNSSLKTAENFSLGKTVDGAGYGDLSNDDSFSAWDSVANIISGGTTSLGVHSRGKLSSLNPADNKDYGIVNRDLYDNARKEVAFWANLQRLKLIIAHYRKESRNIVEQELSSKQSYTQSNLVEEAVAKEAQYLTDVIGAMQTRMEYKRQTQNARASKYNNYKKKKYQLGLGIAAGVTAGFLSKTPWGMTLALGLMTTSFYAPIIYDSTNPNAETKLNEFSEYDSYLYDFDVSTTAGMEKNYTFVDSSAVGKKVSNIMEDGVQDYYVYGSIFGSNIGKGGSGKLSLSGLQILDSILSAKTESRAMVHQELTSVGSASSSSSAKSAVQTESQLASIKASNFVKLINDIKTTRQRKADAEYEKKWVKIKANMLLATYSLVIIYEMLVDYLSAKAGTNPFDNIKNMLGSSGYAASAFAMTNLISMFADLTRTFGDYMAANDSQIAQIITKNLNTEESLRKAEKNNKKKTELTRDGAMAAAEDTQENIANNVDTNNSGSVMAAQATFKQMEKLKEAIMKVAKAQRSARALIKAKTTGIAGSAGTSLAETIVKMNADLADTLFNIMTSAAQAREEYDRANDPSAKLAQLALTLVQTVNAGIDLGLKIEKGLFSLNARLEAAGYVQERDPVTQELKWKSPQEQRTERINKLYDIAKKMGFTGNIDLSTEAGMNAAAGALTDFFESKGISSGAQLVEGMRLLGQGSNPAFTQDEINAATASWATSGKLKLSIGDSTSNRYFNSLFGSGLDTRLSIAEGAWDKIAGLFSNSNRPAAGTGTGTGQDGTVNNPAGNDTGTADPNNLSVKSVVTKIFVGLGMLLNLVGTILGGNLFASMLPEMTGLYADELDEREKSLARIREETLKMTSETGEITSANRDVIRNLWKEHFKRFGVDRSIMIVAASKGDLAAMDETQKLNQIYAMTRAYVGCGIMLEAIDAVLNDPGELSHAQIEELKQYQRAILYAAYRIGVGISGIQETIRGETYDIFNEKGIENIVERGKTIKYGNENRDYYSSDTLLKMDGEVERNRAALNSVIENMKKYGLLNSNGQVNNDALASFQSDYNAVSERFGGHLVSIQANWHRSTDQWGTQDLNIEDLMSGGTVNWGRESYRNGRQVANIRGIHMEIGEPGDFNNQASDNTDLWELLKNINLLIAMLLRDLKYNRAELKRAKKELDERIKLAQTIVAANPANADIALLLTSTSQAQINSIVSRHNENRAELLLHSMRVATRADKPWYSMFQTESNRGSIWSLSQLFGLETPAVAAAKRDMERRLAGMRGQIKDTVKQYLINNFGMSPRDAAAAAEQIANKIVDRIMEQYTAMLRSGRRMTQQDIDNFVNRKIGELDRAEIRMRSQIDTSINPENPSSLDYTKRVSLEVSFGIPPINVALPGHLPVTNSNEHRDSTITANVIPLYDNPATETTSDGTTLRSVQYFGARSGLRLGQIISNQAEIALNFTDREKNTFNSLLNADPGLKGLVVFENGKLIIKGKLTDAQKTALKRIVNRTLGDRPSSRLNGIRTAVNTLIDQVDNLMERGEFQRIDSSSQTIVREGRIISSFVGYTTYNISAVNSDQVGATVNTIINYANQSVQKGVAINVRGISYLVKKDGDRVELFRVESDGSLTELPGGQNRLAGIIKGTDPFTVRAGAQSGTSGVPIVRRYEITQQNIHTGNAREYFNTLINSMNPGERLEITFNGQQYIIECPQDTEGRGRGALKVSIVNNGNASESSLAAIRIQLDILDEGAIVSNVAGDAVLSADSTIVSRSTGSFQGMLTDYARSAHRHNQLRTWRGRLNYLAESRRRSQKAALWNSYHQPVIRLNGSISVADISPERLQEMSDTEVLSYLELCSGTNRDYSLDRIINNKPIWDDSLTDQDIQAFVENRIKNDPKLRFASARQKNQFIRAEVEYLKAARAYLKGMNSNDRTRQIRKLNDPIYVRDRIRVLKNKTSLTERERNELKFLEEFSKTRAGCFNNINLLRHQRNVVAEGRSIVVPHNDALQSLINRHPDKLAYVNGKLYILGFLDQGMIQNIKDCYNNTDQKNVVETALTGLLTVDISINQDIFNMAGTNIGTDTRNTADRIKDILGVNETCFTITNGTISIKPNMINNGGVLAGLEALLRAGVITRSEAENILRVRNNTEIRIDTGSTSGTSDENLPIVKSLLGKFSITNALPRLRSNDNVVDSNQARILREYDDQADIVSSFNESMSEQSAEVIAEMVRDPELMSSFYAHIHDRALAGLSNDSGLDGFIYALQLLNPSMTRDQAENFIRSNFPIPAKYFIPDTVIQNVRGAPRNEQIMIEFDFNGKKEKITAANYDELLRKIEQFETRNRAALNRTSNRAAKEFLKKAKDDAGAMARNQAVIVSLLNDANKIASIMKLGMYKSWIYNTFMPTTPQSDGSFSFKSVTESAGLRAERLVRSAQILNDRYKIMRRADEWMDRNLTSSNFSNSTIDQTLDQFGADLGIPRDRMAVAKEFLKELIRSSGRGLSDDDIKARLQTIFPGLDEQMRNNIFNHIKRTIMHNGSKVRPNSKEAKELMRYFLTNVYLNQEIYSRIQIYMPTMSGVSIGAGNPDPRQYLELQAQNMATRIMRFALPEMIRKANISDDDKKKLKDAGIIQDENGNLSFNVSSEEDLQNKLSSISDPKLKQKILDLYRRYDRTIGDITQHLYTANINNEEGYHGHNMSMINLSSYTQVLFMKDSNNNFIFPESLRNTVFTVNRSEDLELLSNLNANFGFLENNQHVDIKIGNNTYRIKREGNNIKLFRKTGNRFSAVSADEVTRLIIEQTKIIRDERKNGIRVNILSKSDARTAYQAFMRAPRGTIFNFNIRGKNIIATAGDPESIRNMEATFRDAQGNDIENVLTGNFKNLRIEELPETTEANADRGIGWDRINELAEEGYNYQHLINYQNATNNALYESMQGADNTAGYSMGVMRRLSYDHFQQEADGLALIRRNNRRYTNQFNLFIYNSLFPAEENNTGGLGNQGLNSPSNIDPEDNQNAAAYYDQLGPTAYNFYEMYGAPPDQNTPRGQRLRISDPSQITNVWIPKTLGTRNGDVPGIIKYRGKCYNVIIHFNQNEGNQQNL